jgi:hypothetical protein
MQTTSPPTASTIEGQPRKALPAKDYSSRFGRWPLGVNPDMDTHAKRNGLAHWSCVSPSSNDWWVRADGKQFQVFQCPKQMTYMEELQMVDLVYPLNAPTP